MPGDPEGFFSESLEQSRVKAAIVAEYFFIWAKIIIPNAKKTSKRIGYIDLFAGPGRYDDGTKSTPLLIVERAIADPDMRKMLVCIFNDAAEAHSQSLDAAIKALPGVETLKYQPHLQTSEVDDETVKQFERIRLVPSFAFIDPWGYRGLSLPLLRAVLKDWGCDCVFFFNYNRINMGLDNPSVERHMAAIFGERRLAELRALLPGLDPTECEAIVMRMLTDALRELGGKYVLPFRFRNEEGRVSHYLIFVAKHFRGYERMKEVMAKHSSSATDGIPSLEFDPRDPHGEELELPFHTEMDSLKEMLLGDHAGKRLTVRTVFEEHSVGRPYILTNYRDALKQLEAEGQIQVDPPVNRRPKRKGEVTLAETAVVIFPKG
jgi:three-Cys-motif partner protein